MEGLTCDFCGARPFKFRAALSTHQKTCVGTKRLRQEEQHVSSRTAGIPQSSEAVDPLPCHNASGPSEPIFFPVDEPIDDVLDVEAEQFAEKDDSRFLYDSTFSLVNWARTIRRGEGLSNNAINRLFKEVLLHPSFKLEDLSVKSAYDIEKYERSLYSEADGWRVEDIDGHILHYRDPLIALEALFSSPVVAPNFTSIPASEVANPQLREYLTPVTGNWWCSMQVKL